MAEDTETTGTDDSVVQVAIDPEQRAEVSVNDPPRRRVPAGWVGAKTDAEPAAPAAGHRVPAGWVGVKTDAEPAAPAAGHRVPSGWIGAQEEAPARRRGRPGVPLQFAHLPLGQLPRRTADWDDADRTKYPTRGDIMSAHTEITPVRFHPDELPDPEAAFAARMYPQLIPSYQIDEENETHSLGEGVAVDSPVRLRNRRK